MRKHICFESIDCKDLLYMKPASTFVCLRYYCDLKRVDDCMSCRFHELRMKELELKGKEKA